MPDPIPAMLLARLAIDVDHQGHQVGANPAAPDASLEGRLRRGVLRAAKRKSSRAVRQGDRGPSFEALPRSGFVQRSTSSMFEAASGSRARALVLGAWGCGVFRNDPEKVAEMWHYHLHKPAFAGAFDRVVFAIRHDRRQKAAGADGVASDAVAALLTSGVAFHADHFHISVSRACYDGKDNDGDGLVDLADPGCTDALDDTE